MEKIILYFTGVFKIIGNLNLNVVLPTLLIFPVAVFCVVIILSAFFDGVKGLDKSFYDGICNFICLLTLLYTLCSVYVKSPILNIFTAVLIPLSAKIIYKILYSILKLIKSEKVKNTVKPDFYRDFEVYDKPVKDCIIIKEQTPLRENIPQENKSEYFESSVRLSHVFSIIDKLKNSKLTPSDRLEVDAMERGISYFRQKSELTAEQKDRLNDSLSSLLKMMSKYEL